MQLDSDDSPWGWASTIQEFLAADQLDILDALKSHHKERFPQFDLNQSQLSAWIRTIDTFQNQLEPLTEVDGGGACLIVFEYELPGEGGRRPDVIIVTPTNHVCVLECKNRGTLRTPDINQVVQYRNDLTSYHDETPPEQTRAYISLLDGEAATENNNDEVAILDHGPDGFDPLLADLRDALTNPLTYEPTEWLEADYTPMPELTDAVVETFQEGGLSYIKEFHRSTNVEDAIECIQSATERAVTNQKHILVLVTGAPGSGKTMVGLQSSVLLRDAGHESLYLSGNGPLVAVIQDALRRAGATKQAAKSIIRPVIEFKSAVTGLSSSAPADVYIFDEGQRAWTDDKLNNFDGNEIELLVDVAERRDAGVLVGLIGEGQAIHEGEEGDLAAWIRSLDRASGDETDWEIMLPERNIPEAEAITADTTKSTLHLDTNIRAKYAHRLHEWVDQVLAGDAKAARKTAETLQNGGYNLMVTKSRSKAEEYVTEEFHHASGTKYGWLISAKHRDRDDPEGMKPPFIDDDATYGDWFNAPATEPGSSCQLEHPVTEFGCQGLEIDFGLVFWGNDLTWNGSEWAVRDGVREYEESPQSPMELTKNVYRVLLTRGRQGIIIRCWDTETRRYLEECGASYLR